MSSVELLMSATAGDYPQDKEPFATPGLQCPVCVPPQHLSNLRGGGPWPCARCGFVLSEVNGIFRGLAPDRDSHFRQFIREYELVRAQEGRGSLSPEYYMALPFTDLTGRNTWQWQIRAKTWRHMERYLLPVIELSYPEGCDVLDVGAGNCWLSYRLGQRGHRPVAVDLLENDADGLGAARHYLPRASRPFLRFQAEMDSLPFVPQQFDIVVFNASFHYSVDYERTLNEALRCLRKPGYVIIADSPFYSRDENGRKMLVEKRAEFERRFGFRSDSIQSREYLTPEVLSELAEKPGLRWTIVKPWYGVNWALRPVKARLLQRREPARFYLLWTKVDN
jgi:SAM-dependent methyltransferase